MGAANDVFSDYDLTGKKRYARYVSAGGSGIDYAYDTAERLVTETSYGRALAFGLDQAGNRSTLTWPGTAGLVRYLYDADNRMTSLYETASGGTPVLTYGLIPGTLY